MPTLPTITITDQATWDRLFAAFNGDPVAYKTWLKDRLVERVRQVESQSAGVKAVEDMNAGIPTT